MYRTIQLVERVFDTFLAIIGIPGNLLAIVILSWGKCGVCQCTTRYLLAMAAADMTVIFTDIILMGFRYYYYPRSFLDITPVCNVIGILLRTSTDSSVWFTVTFSFDRFVTICCQKLKTKYCTEKTATVVLATTCTLFCLKNIPFYFQNEPGVIIDNVPFYCYTKSSYLTETWWVILDWLDTVLTPLLPFALILLLNAVTVRHILVTSQVRKRLKGERKGENRRDPEMESRRKSVILLFTISGNFILLWLIYVVYFLYYVIAGIDPVNYSPLLHHFGIVGYMLQRLSSCTNTFIYLATLSKFRAKISNAANSLVTQIPCIMNK
ncbi:probable G-protein coupled receptor 139 [Stegostoma tigrinum]|uniref:probable G-protein coupled receptor 139 n=1 Tax=Stegostoma tigrinum TaxID=3053191 RepID=UPI00202B2743|nr:probable G-protein coupled receptor 139 [Stegostoma tigrinum]